MSSSRISAVAGVLFALAMASVSTAHADQRLTVVELFQSQGCSSCPPANANVMALAERADVLALSFGVTYWDYLGWKDTFARPAFTQRQRDYARGLGLQNVYTPQVVINGAVDTVGVDRADLDRAVRRAVRPPFEPALAVSGRTLTIQQSAGKVGAADVWLVWYDPRVVQVPIRRGENGGRTLPHRNVVKDIVRLGAWSGRAGSYTLPTAPDTTLGGAILLQRADGGAIIAAERIAAR